MQQWGRADEEQPCTRVRRTPVLCAAWAFLQKRVCGPFWHATGSNVAALQTEAVLDTLSDE